MEPIGYSFLISYFSLTVLVPYKKSYLTTHAVRTKELSPEGEEEFFPPKFRTDGTWQSHLLFAIKQGGGSRSRLCSSRGRFFSCNCRDKRQRQSGEDHQCCENQGKDFFHFHKNLSPFLNFRKNGW